MATLYSMNSDQLAELTELVANSNWEYGPSTGLQHTNNRIWLDENGISAEQICKNQYGSAYGLNAYSWIPKENLPEWLELDSFGSSNWTDLES